MNEYLKNDNIEITDKIPIDDIMILFVRSLIKFSEMSIYPIKNKNEDTISINNKVK